jgi:1-deoxyxylulose-5-phosphate synthase
MIYKNLGRTGLKVSRICLGTMAYGYKVDQTQATNIIKEAYAAGVNFIDSADVYPTPDAAGRSEEFVGTAVAGQRQNFVIATKVGVPIGPNPFDRGLSRRHLMDAVENSLKRLKTDYIDLYYCHFPDFDTPLEESLRAFDDMVHQGKVRYIGCSNFGAWLLCKAMWVSDVHDLSRFECVQSPYNLLTRDIETELIPLCSNEGVGLTVFNPLAGEMLTGRHEFSKPPLEGRFTEKGLGPAYLQRYWNEKNFEAVDSLKKLAQSHGCSLVQFALAWILNNQTVTALLTGVISTEQLKENVKAAEIQLSPEEIKACDEVWSLFRPSRFFYASDGNIKTK